MTLAGSSELGVFETVPIGRIRPSTHNPRMALESVQDWSLPSVKTG
ncbi:MAG: hypothetical protein JRN09_03370 [Nitrososphaerota archaeon]|jgi:hypothetical protein|nr:hypothetical protein [Nitrososphaerota archaeon]